jgi:hypothetical protein
LGTTAIVAEIRARSEDEADRSPTWFSPGAALVRLAENREPEYVQEHERLVEAALQAIPTVS